MTRIGIGTAILVAGCVTGVFAGGGTALLLLFLLGVI